MKPKLGFVFFFLASVISCQIHATAYFTPPAHQAIIGRIQFSSVDDSITGLAKRYDLGYNAIESANPQLRGDGLTVGAPLKIPSQHLLPNQPRHGIVINLPEMRMYYYQGNKIFTYPIGIGKLGKTIPITRAVITRKATNPTWVPPDSIRQFNLEQGIVLPQVMPPGPDNPLGPYAIYMSIPTYLIHSTIFPESVGKRASFGCIRMYEHDIEQFFPTIRSGIPVVIINSPVKVGWHNNRLFVEAHQALEESHSDHQASLPGMVKMISNVTGQHPVLVDWQALSYVARERDGIPHDVAVRLR